MFLTSHLVRHRILTSAIVARADTILVCCVYHMLTLCVLIRLMDSWDTVLRQNPSRGSSAQPVDVMCSGGFRALPKMTPALALGAMHLLLAGKWNHGKSLRA